MPLRVPDKEEQSHSVMQKQAHRRYPTQGPKHDARLPWVISSHPCGSAGCHGPLRLLHPSHRPGPGYLQSMGPFTFTHPGTIMETRELLQQCLHSALQLRGSHQGAVPTLHAHVAPLAIPPSPQHWYRPSLCPSPARDVKANRSWPGRERSFSLEPHCLLF